MAPPLPSLLFLSLVTARLFNAFDIISYPFLLRVVAHLQFFGKDKSKISPQFFFSQFSLPVLQLQRFSTADYYRAKGRTFFPKKKRVCIVYTYIYIHTQYLFIPRFRGENRRGTVKLSALPCENIETRGVTVGFCLSNCKPRGYRRDPQAKENGDSGDCSRHRWKTRFRVFPGKTFSMVERSFQPYLFENLIILAITRQLLTHEGRWRGNRACSLDVNLHYDAVSKLLPRYVTEDDANFAISPTKR